MFRSSWRRAAAGTITVTVLTAALFVAACTNGSNASEERLVVYSGRSESLVAPVIEQFSELTGIQVDVNYAGTGELAATLLEEGDNTPADVFFAQDPGGLGSVADMLAVLPDDIVQAVPEWARSPEGKWVGTSGRMRVVVYNTDSLSEEELPDSIWDFVEPEWRGRIGWAPTNGSFQAMVTSMRLTWGEQKTREWLDGIMANEPSVYSNNTGVVQAAAAGEVEVGFVNHYYLHRFLAEEGPSYPARNHYLGDGEDPGATMLVAGAGILEDAKNRENAEKFVKFLLSTVGQQYFAGQTYEYPLVEGVVRDANLPPVDSFPKLRIDQSLLGDLEATQELLRQAGAL